MTQVTRLNVIQGCLDLFNMPSYLEIGVWKGKTFFPAKAERKVAVDPKFAFDVKAAEATYETSTFHEVTSDKYFGSLPKDESFDVIYIDGLHTFDQTLRDLLNSLAFLKDDGIVIIDDVYPREYHSALANVKHAHLVKAHTGSTNKEWMGDVYKLTFFIDSYLQQYSYRMVSDNHGQLVMWRAVRPSVTERTVENVSRAPFESILLEAEAQRRMPLSEILDELRHYRSKSA